MRNKRKLTDKPQLHLICNAHLDPYWQWEWEEGAAAAVSTFRTAADCCDLSDSFIFCHNEVILYQWVESFEPELFRRIRRLVKAGRWHIMGGWYLQPDCNMPCGESFVRQMLIGKRWFLAKFGVEPRTAINFDSFGHTRGLVQILRRGGYDSYIAMRPGDVGLPLEFVWVGYDGSEITVKRVEVCYNTPSGTAPARVREFKEKLRAGRPVTLRLWGVGNHGGGPSRKDVKDLDAYIAATTDCEIKHSTPEAFFAALRASGMALPRVERDLNPTMVGCYTSQVRVKQKHRLLENELYATETMLATAAMQGRLRYPGADLRTVMQDLATAQFHDLLPGTSVQNVEEAGLRLLDHGLEILSRQKARAFFALAAGQPPAADGEIPILIYNPHPWPVTGIWECEFGLADFSFNEQFTLGKAFQNGRELPSQIEKENSNLNADFRKRIVFAAELAPASMNRFDCRLEVAPARPTPRPQTVDGKIRFDNGVMQVEIDAATGWLTRYAVGGLDYLQPGAFRLLVMKDNEDPWGMLVKQYREADGEFTLLSPGEGSRFSGLRPENVIESVRVIEDGPARLVIEAVFGFRNSFAVQTYKFPRHGTEMEIQVRVFWNEKNRMLKWSVPTRLSGSRCLGQVACGIESLPVTGEELVSQQWLMMADDERRLALSVANDGIYGSDCKDGELRLSLLRSPAYCGHPIGERSIVPQDRFLPRIDQGERLYTFRVNASGLEERLAAIGREALVLNQKPMSLSFFPSGHGEPPQSGAQVDDPVVQLQAVKQAEDGTGWIVRLFNASAAARTTRLSIPPLGVKTRVRLGAYELKTLLLARKGETPVEADLIERPLSAARRRNPRQG
ncbi:MAG: glycoside hydrolase family 38 C-terminal domain-containing protein [bacterium]